MATEIALSASIELGDGAKSLKALKQEFKEAQKELDGLTVGSEKYVQALKKLGGIKEDIADLNDEIKAFSPEGKVKAFGNVITGVASGFQAATGAAALFGGENKELEKTLVKLQAVMAFTEGLKGLTSLGDGFKVLSNIIKANPLFLIVGLVASIGTALFALKDKIGIIGDAFDFLGNIINTVVQGGKDFLDFLGLTDFAMEKTANSIIDSSNRIKNATTDRYDSEIAAAKRAGKETELLEIQKLQAITKTNDAVIQQLRLRQQAQGELSEEDKKELDARVQENRKAYQEILNLSDAYKDREVTNQQKITDKTNAELEKRKADHQKYLDAVADAINAEADAYDVKRKAQKEQIKEAEEQGYKDAVALADQMTSEYNREQLAKAELNALYKVGDLESQLIYLNEKQRIDLENTELTESERLLIKEKYAKLATQVEQEQTNRGLEIAAASNQALTGLSDLYFTVKRNNLKKGSAEELKAAKQQFEINKKLSLVSATISGIQAVINAYQSGAAVPVYGVVLGPLYAALAAVAAGTNIAKIASSKFDGGGSVGSVASAASSAPVAPSAPSLNAPSNGSTQLNPDGSVRQSTPAEQPTIKAVVVETDVTKTQKNVGSIESNAKV